jgi:hypothetical protein
MSGEPVGLKCPGCGEPPLYLLGGGTQAFCGTDDCPWLTWDPTKTLAELNAGPGTIGLPDFSGGRTPETPEGPATTG